MEEMQLALRNMASKYEGLQRKYDNLSKLYMDLLKLNGAAPISTVEELGLEWRLEEGVGGFRMREGTRDKEMLGQEVDVYEFLFGSGRMGIRGEGVGEGLSNGSDQSA